MTDNPRGGETYPRGGKCPPSPLLKCNPVYYIYILYTCIKGLVSSVGLGQKLLLLVNLSQYKTLVYTVQWKDLVHLLTVQDSTCSCND